MKYLSYLGETVLTTDGVSDAVVEYARALVDDRSTDIIHIPVVLDDAESTATLLLGPSSQLIVVEAQASEIPLKDKPVIARMRARIAALGPHRALAADATTANDEALGFDFL